MGSTRRELETVQKIEKLNTVFAADLASHGGASHHYVVALGNGDEKHILFQKGPRGVEDSVDGVLDTDLLEMVRDRFAKFQEGSTPSMETACALYHIEEALQRLNARVEDRAARAVLGTYEK